MGEKIYTEGGSGGKLGGDGRRKGRWGDDLNKGRRKGMKDEREDKMGERFTEREGGGYGRGKEK